MCNSLHLYIHPEGQIECPLKLVNFLERALVLLLPGATKKPCGLFFDYTLTHTHACTSHIHTQECHTHVTQTHAYVTHTNTSHTHTCVTHIHIMSRKYK